MKKGLSLIEILVAAVTLGIIVTGVAITFTSVKRLSYRFAYRYTALNLAKDVLEFGEATRFPSGFTLRYSYSPATSDYRLTSYTNFNPSDEDPFDYMGDIKAKGLAPRGAPDSVVIFYEVASDPNFYGAHMHTVKITWRENPTDPEQKLVLGVLPIRANNDQLGLSVGEFWWE